MHCVHNLRADSQALGKVSVERIEKGVAGYTRMKGLSTFERRLTHLWRDRTSANQIEVEAHDHDSC